MELYHLSAVLKSKTHNTLYKEVVADALRQAFQRTSSIIGTRYRNKEGIRAIGYSVPQFV